MMYSSAAIQSVVNGKKSLCQFLTANDTGKSGGHQSGIYISKSACSLLFDKPCERGSNSDRWVKILWQDEFYTESRFIYYGSKTRNEYRITNCVSKDYDPLDEENTGALFILVQNDSENYSGWILNTDDEIEDFLSTFNININDTGKLIDKTTINSSVRIKKEIDQFVSEFTAEFPTSEEISAVARKIHSQIFNHKENIILDPDKILLQWLDLTYQVFKDFEENRYTEIIHRGFESMQTFLDLANSILNRRKSRAGKSFELQLEAIFRSNNLIFEKQVVTEGNKRPDFIFPGGSAYHNPKFNADKLIVLGVKTTCKDRWRQILNEADRVRGKNKYLCTLQEGISSKQLQEMKNEKVILVVPRTLISKYPKAFQAEILDLITFIKFVKETIV